MKLNVNPNRMELLRLKSKLKLAFKGHKLLKDKQEELIRQFMLLIHQNKELREEVDASLARAYQSFQIARAINSPQAIELALQIPFQKSSLESKERSILTLRLPVFDIESSDSFICYGFKDTTSELDETIKIYSETFKKMIKLAEIEKAILRLADEIEKTRRRVNALEYVLIPNLQETIAFIKMKLDEMERSTIVKVMKIKSMIFERKQATG